MLEAFSFGGPGSEDGGIINGGSNEGNGNSGSGGSSSVGGCGGGSGGGGIDDSIFRDDLLFIKTTFSMFFEKA